MKIASRGHVLRQVVYPGEPGDTIVVLDGAGNELGRAIATPTGNIIAHFNPPLQLPPTGQDYEIHRVPGSKSDGA